MSAPETVEVPEPRPEACPHCDFSSGTRGMDRCSKCRGTGSIFRIHKVFPNTKDGFEAARRMLSAEARQADAATRQAFLEQAETDRAAQAKRIAEQDERIIKLNDMANHAEAFSKIVDEQRERIAELEAGLREFADFAAYVAERHPGWDHDEFTIIVPRTTRNLAMAPFRRARSLLSTAEKGSG